MKSQHAGKVGPARLSAAVIGGSGVIALAALGVAIGQQETHGDVNGVQANGTGMTVGATYTETTPSTAPEKGLRVTPTIKGPAPLPSEEAAAK
jgi:hypothetical protein